MESQTQLAGTADALASAFSLWLRVPRPGCSLLGLKYAAAPSDANAGLGSALTKAGGRVAFGASRMPFTVVPADPSHAGAVVLSLLLAPRARAQPLHTVCAPGASTPVACNLRLAQSSGPSELRHVAACAEHIAVAASAANLLEFLRSARYAAMRELARFLWLSVVCA